jgi:hypothetical protein
VELPHAWAVGRLGPNKRWFWHLNNRHRRETSAIPVECFHPSAPILFPYQTGCQARPCRTFSFSGIQGPQYPAYSIPLRVTMYVWVRIVPYSIRALTSRHAAATAQRLTEILVHPLAVPQTTARRAIFRNLAAPPRCHPGNLRGYPPQLCRLPAPIQHRARTSRSPKRSTLPLHPSPLSVRRFRHRSGTAPVPPWHAGSPLPSA